MGRGMRSTAMMHRIVIVFFCAVLSSSVAGFASTLSVNIVGIAGGVTQSLPISYVQSFQRWMVAEDEQILSRACNSQMSEVEWRSDMQIRPTLDVLIKSGAPSYVMAGLQVKGADQDICPLARQWTTFSLAVEPSFRVEAFVTNGPDDAYSLELGENPAVKMKRAMEQFGLSLSQMSEGSPLSDGFHIVSIPLESDWTKLPAPEKGPYTVTCLATSEPEASELLTMDLGLVEMTASSIMEFRVVPPAVNDDATTCPD